MTIFLIDTDQLVASKNSKNYSQKYSLMCNVVISMDSVELLSHNP